MIRVFAIALCCLLSLASASVLGTDNAPRAFTVHSMQVIRAEQAGKPFVLAVWSVYCEPCRDELATLGQFKAKHSALPVILVAADPPADALAIATVLSQYHLDGIERWAFADAFEEPLRYAIDPRWRGELPRTYLFDADHHSTTVVGRLNGEALEIWQSSVQQH